MFADIEGFTQLSREMPTDQLAHLTREVLALLTEQVHRFEGTLDKYIGDAVMALWNAPLDQPDHADRAMRCALSMVAALEKWNMAHPEWPDIRIHIAINTGEAMVGDLGTPLRHTYTAIGHTVNQADRLLGCARDAQRPVVISVNTEARLQMAYESQVYCVCREHQGCAPPRHQQRLL
jgi:adenylate cyclase